MIEDIFILGATGNVGKALVKQVYEKGDTDFNKHVNPTRIVGVASSSKYEYSELGLSQSETDLFNSNSNGVRYEKLDDILDNVRNTFRPGNSNLVFVDATSAMNDMTEFHKKIVNNTDYGIVTANKNPLAFSDFKTFQKLTEDTSRYGYRCSVMAGAGAVSMIQDLKDVNDLPISISGCFSGTLGYISSEICKGRNLSDVIKEAHEKGYTEPNPKDDLNGLDVARKLLILSRTAGYDVNLDEIEVKPFIPNEYLLGHNVDSLIENIKKEVDNDFNDWVISAKNNNNVLRYAAQMDLVNGKPKMKVGLEEVPMDSQLGMLDGTMNKLIVETSTYPKGSEFSIVAPGAGPEVTAQNVRRNLLYHLVGRKNLI